MAKRIGLTMRVANAQGYDELRDSLARDWAAFMTAALPDVQWLPVPNLGASVIEFAAAWRLDGFLFTGGNDLGESVLRDDTERAILQWALRDRLPVFGVCRGLQIIQRYFGGNLQRCRREDHVGVRHEVKLAPLSSCSIPPPEVREVNSFHHWAVPLKEVPAVLQVFATTDDGWAEGLVHREAHITAVQWHPERLQPFAPHDQQLLRRTFDLAA